MTGQPFQIRAARTEDELKAARDLVMDFIRGLPVSVDFQDVHGELDDFPSRFLSVLIAADSRNRLVGVVALKDLSAVTPGMCEMKRMYVAPTMRGTGVGAALVQAIIEDATARGFTSMVLDTLERLPDAVRLYERTGFQRRGAYYENPYEDAVFMERSLQP